MYRKLDPEHIVGTLERLQRRIVERFPGAGLSAVCAELTEMARQAQARSDAIAKPELWLRSLIGLVLATGVVVFGLSAVQLFGGMKASDELFGTLQGIEAGFNILLLLGAALFFLMSLEQRLKRKRALDALHEFRSIVHVIDMHQLTKDPSMIGGARTSASPERSMTPFEIMRYLDYCTEMLSLAGKCAALYAEKLPDGIVTETVGDIEQLATNLSQKIWQKITIIESSMPTGTGLSSNGRRQ